MLIYNVYWTSKVNMLKIKCDCGKYFDWQTNISLITCPYCGYNEWWHSDAIDYSGFEQYNLKTAKLNIKR